MKIEKFNISPFVANQYSSSFSSLNQKIDALFKHLNNDFIVTGNRVKKYTKIAREKLKSDELSPEMAAKIRLAVKSFDIIVVELQYHDIIRQKLEHIHYFERKLSSEFNHIYEKQDLFKAPRYTLVLYDLVKLAYNQLASIRKDYLNASLKIQKLLLNLWADRDISKELQLFLFNTAESLKSVLDALDTIIKMHDKLRKENPGMEVIICEELRMSILNEIKCIYTMESERQVFNETFKIKEEEVVMADDDIFF